MTDECRCAKIRALNDELRTQGTGGRVFMTNGLVERGEAFIAAAFQAMREFTDFTEENDPHQEHDFGRIEVEGEAILWKIDYYDASMEFGSENPADPAVTTRVLTVMLAHDY